MPLPKFATLQYTVHYKLVLVAFLIFRVLLGNGQSFRSVPEPEALRCT
jgi:hypothetical protein